MLQNNKNIAETIFAGIKTHYIELIIAFSLIGFCYPVNIQTQYSFSGGVTCFVSDFVLLILVVLSIIDATKLETELSERIACVFFFIVIIWTVIISIYRSINCWSIYKGIYYSIRTATPICAFSMILDKRKINSVIKTVNIAIAIIFLVVIVENTIENTIGTDVLLNRNLVVYTCILSFIFGVLLLWTNDNNIWIYVLFSFNSLFGMVYLCLAGSRMGVCGGIITIVSIVIIEWNKRFLRAYISFFVLASVIVSIMLYTNAWSVQFFSFRGIDFSTIVKSISFEREINANTTNSDNAKRNNQDYGAIPDELNANTTNSDNAKRNNQDYGAIPDELFVTEEIVLEKQLTSEEIMVINDASRFYSWRRGVERVKEAPLVGTGNMSVFQIDGVNQGPHNFILEYAIIYGLVGVLFMGIFILQLTFPIILKRPLKEKMILLLSMLMTFSMAFLQPILVTGIGPSITWVLLYCISEKCSDDKK